MYVHSKWNVVVSDISFQTENLSGVELLATTCAGQIASLITNIHVATFIVCKSALGRVCNTHCSSKTSLYGFDVTMWLQHLVLVPQMCSDRP